MTQKLLFKPNYGVRPGALIEEYLGHLDISARELARRCGRSAKLISEIVSGKAPLEPGTALQLERVLQVDAAVWLGMESLWRLHLARQDETAQLQTLSAWADRFPIQELKGRDLIGHWQDRAGLVRELLRFFGVGGKDAFEAKFEDLLVCDYRHSPSFLSEPEAVASWLRVGELRAEKIETQPFSRKKFLSALQDLRSLTTEPIDSILQTIVDRSAACGVVFILEKSFGRVALSGVSRWLSPDKALIQQTFRHLSDDHFWFTFFHECAHILLHSRKTVFIDAPGDGNADPEKEAEANEWASNFLIPEAALTRFITRSNLTEAEIRAFAEEQGISAGIVVGQLQHRKVLQFSQMNRLKTRYKWN